MKVYPTDIRRYIKTIELILTLNKITLTVISTQFCIRPFRTVHDITTHPPRESCNITPLVYNTTA